MNCEAVAAHTGVEGIVAEVDAEAEPISVIRQRSTEIVHQKPGRDTSDTWCMSTCLRRHLPILDRDRARLLAMLRPRHDDWRRSCRAPEQRPAL
jgi:hypothetical protein